MKKLILIVLIPFLIASCGKSKEDIFDKCLTQANETWSKEKIYNKELQVRGCMAGYGYKFIGMHTEEICPALFLSSNCYK
jgi:hypothetical protein